MGRSIKVGRSASDFRVSSFDLKEVRLSDLSQTEINSITGVSLPTKKGKIKLINSFPSLDTPVCDL
ncbi:MAG: hypothetical protein ACK4NT_03180, partial [Candidatus Omnitrophota bacterium]